MPGQAVTLEFGRYDRAQITTNQDKLRFGVEGRVGRLLRKFANRHDTVNGRRCLARATGGQGRFSK